MTKELVCQDCGSTENLAENKQGKIHCNKCCTEENDLTGQICQSITSRGNGN